MHTSHVWQLRGVGNPRPTMNTDRETHIVRVIVKNDKIEWLALHIPL